VFRMPTLLELAAEALLKNDPSLRFMKYNM